MFKEMANKEACQWRCQVAGPVTQDGVMKKSKLLYHGHRFPAEVISCAVRWY
jgi:hypothetical protein